MLMLADFMIEGEGKLITRYGGGGDKGVISDGNVLSMGNHKFVIPRRGAQAFHDYILYEIEDYVQDDEGIYRMISRRFIHDKRGKIKEAHIFTGPMLKRVAEKNYYF